MSLIKSKNTKPELVIRKYLFSKGFRYRLHYKIVGKPDIAFPTRKIALFVNGCFWHGHNCKAAQLPTTNAEFWRIKIERNKARDVKVAQELLVKGWKVLIVWQCEIKNKLMLQRTLQSLFEQLGPLS